ncbi:MAG: argininosuccinate synthase [Imperialibacter sp.]|uniref:argininosuccinate synthase n=1 Tax=Imperialibacter sp. TaxID=2038411 RepID=UPI003A8B9E8E
MKKKVLLAYSGGLDTSYCLIYLQSLGYEVHTALADTGGFTKEELDVLATKANKLGAASHQVLNIVEEYYQEGIRFLLYGNVLKNQAYPLSVSAERVFQARAIARLANQLNVDAIAHGSTGAGNDQVRFDLVFQALCPGKEIIAPIREKKLSREEEIQFLKEHKVDMNFDKALYSVNQGLWGTSVGGKETLGSNGFLPEEAFPSKVTESVSKSIVIEFEKGQPVGLDGKKMKPVEVIKALNALGGSYGIGRDIHVGDTILGIKGRVGFEAPAPAILIKAHQGLEKHVLSKFQLQIKEQQSLWYGQLMHEGLWLDPACRNLEAFLESSQARVTGKVFVVLAPYRFQVHGIESKFDLMNNLFGKYGEMNSLWSADDAKGFAKIFGVQQMIIQKVGEHAGE